MAVLSTLEYLKKGGRISSATAIATDILSIKLVIAVIDGEVRLVGKAIGSRKSNNLLTKMIENKGGIDFNMPYGTVWSWLENSMLVKYIKDSENIWKEKTKDIPMHILGATIGMHVGPKVVGVAFFKKINKSKKNHSLMNDFLLKKRSLKYKDDNINKAKNKGKFF